MATYYDATGGGNCSFDPVSDPSEILVGAMNELDYDGSSVCGSFVNITGPQGSVTVQIVDRCPECPEGNIDLSRKAFGAIAPLEMGLIDISWRFVAVDISTPICYKFNNGSNEWWTSVQIRNHSTSVATVEIKDQNGDWVMLDRQNDNFFSNGAGMGQGPYTIRVTDIFGQQITDSNLPFSIGGIVEGKENFPMPLSTKRKLSGVRAGSFNQVSAGVGTIIIDGVRGFPHKDAQVFTLHGKSVDFSGRQAVLPGVYLIFPRMH
jgi:expansin (peptidoglycan-binding protein)